MESFEKGLSGILLKFIGAIAVGLGIALGCITFQHVYLVMAKRRRLEKRRERLERQLHATTPGSEKEAKVHDRIEDLELG